jgi:hypothetical protein
MKSMAYWKIQHFDEFLGLFSVASHKPVIEWGISTPTKKIIGADKGAEGFCVVKIIEVCYAVGFCLSLYTYEIILALP